jgi:hypothetical protein
VSSVKSSLERAQDSVCIIIIMKLEILYMTSIPIECSGNQVENIVLSTML